MINIKPEKNNNFKVGDTVKVNYLDVEKRNEKPLYGFFIKEQLCLYLKKYSYHQSRNILLEKYVGDEIIKKKINDGTFIIEQNFIKTKIQSY